MSIFGFLMRNKVSVKTYGRDKLIYKDGRKKMYILYERIFLDSSIKIHSYSIKAWEPPYEEEEVSETDRDMILRNIKELLEKKGEIVSFY